MAPDLLAFLSLVVSLGALGVGEVEADESCSRDDEEELSVLQLRIAGSMNTRCEQCVDGCILPNGRCRTESRMYDCFAASEGGEVLSMCNGTLLVQLVPVIRPLAATEHAVCKGCEDGCLANDRCIAGMKDMPTCMAMAAAVGKATICGDEPRNITYLHLAANALQTGVIGECGDCSCCKDGCIGTDGSCRMGSAVSACLSSPLPNWSVQMCGAESPVNISVSTQGLPADICGECRGCVSQDRCFEGMDLGTCVAFANMRGTETVFCGKDEAMAVNVKNAK